MPPLSSFGHGQTIITGALVWKTSSGSARSAASAGADFLLSLLGAVVTCTLARRTRAGRARATAPACAHALRLFRALVTGTLAWRACTSLTRSTAVASAGLSARLGSFSGIWAGFAFAVTLLASALVLSLARRAASGILLGRAVASHDCSLFELYIGCRCVL